MYRADITADLNDEDHSGYVWTFLDEARDPAQITPGALVVAGPGICFWVLAGSRYGVRRLRRRLSSRLRGLPVTSGVVQHNTLT